MAHPGGRPTKYRPAMCQIVESCMAEGMSKVELCRELDCDYNTLLAWQASHPEFLTSIKKGELASQAWWEEQGRKALKDKEFSPTLWFMNMKNRFGAHRKQSPEPWADKTEVEQSGELKISGIKVEFE